MRILKFVMILVFVLAAVPSYSESGRGMVLFKEPPFPTGGAADNPFGVGCNGLYRIAQDEEIPDLSDFRLYNCLGRYTLTLDAPSGKVVTVFGALDYKTDRGFLVIRKSDDKLIWILDLQKFPDRQWFTVPAKGEYGGYEAFYYPAPNFENNLASIKWGEWWGERDLALLGGK